MRGTSLGVLLLLVACGGGKTDADGPPGSGDGPPGSADANHLPDAPVATCTPVSGTNVAFEPLPGLNANLADTPLLVTSPPGDTRLFIVERNGVIQIYADGAMLPDPFLDVNPDTNGGGESGLLGLAFHPDYATNHKFYLYYTASSAGLTQEIVEYQASASDPNVADEATKRTLLSIPDQAGNHNGGMMEFGSDGYLYISVGDGGPQGDPEGDAQNTNSLLGKILRIDVDTSGGGREYGIPGDNPFANGVDGAPEVYVTGMRNAWRWSFDRGTGDMYVGDVGQDAYEEISVLTAGQQNGANLGWNTCEGFHNYPGGGSCTFGVTAASEHSHGSGFNAIIGGQVYRGSCFPDLVGKYFYSDHGASELWSFEYTGGTVQNDHFLIDTPSGPASLHADALGELYLTTADAGPEGVFHLVVQ